MSDPAPKHAGDKTFRFFDQAQGAKYAQTRRDYHANLYEAVANYHATNGGQFGTILDVGCGPGFATRTLANSFQHAIGLDPSDGMISTARSLGGETAASETIRFDVSTAEELGSNLSPPIADGSVDLITAATAAHWFDMEGFWPRAAQILKPGGSVAIWTIGPVRIHSSVPNYKAIQAAMDSFEDHLKDYMIPGNFLTRGLYRDLLLPWTVSKPVLEFDEKSFVRKLWNMDPNKDPDERFFAFEAPADLDTFEKVMGTTSPLTRWREANPDKVGTEEDPVKQTRRKIERALWDAGVEKGKELIKGGVTGVLLLVKKQT